MNNKEIIREFYENIVSNNLIEQLENYIAENCIAEIRKHLKAIRHTYPDYKMKILRQFEDGEFVISEFIMEGTFQNDWIGIKATGEKLKISGVDIDKVENGKIVEHSGATNTFEALWENSLIAPNDEIAK